MDGNVPSYEGDEVDLTIEGIINHQFSTGDSFSKAIIGLYAYYIPKSFADNSLVRIIIPGSRLLLVKIIIIISPKVI